MPILRLFRDDDDVVESDEWFEECEQCRKEFKVQVEWDPIFNTDKLDE